MGHRAAAWRVAFAFLVTMLGTTLPTPLYPLYQSRFHFTDLTVTGLYALYAAGVITALLLFGAWSDQIGRRRMMLAGLLLSGLSAAVFVAAVRMPTIGPAALVAGRVLSGLSVAFVTGTATAALADLAAPGRQRRASLVAAAVNTGGLGTGPLLAGALAQYAREPLQLCFAVDLALVLIAVVGLIRIPEPAAAARRHRPRLQRLRVPAPVRGAFFRAGLAGFASFAVLGLFAAVCAAFLGQVMHESNHAIVGGVACLAFLASTVGQLLSAAVRERRSLLVGCLGLAAGAGLVAESLIRASLPLLVAAAAVSGVSHGMVFRAGLTVVTGASPAGQRAEVASSFFVTLYIGISVPVVGLGAGADRYGLLHAGVAFAAVAGLLALLAFLCLLPRRSLLPRGGPDIEGSEHAGPDAGAPAPAPIAVAWYPATDAVTAAYAAAAAAAVSAAEAASAAATAAAAAATAAAAASSAASAATFASAAAGSAAPVSDAAGPPTVPDGAGGGTASAAPPAAPNPTTPIAAGSRWFGAGPAAPAPGGPVHSRPHANPPVPYPRVSAPPAPPAPPAPTEPASAPPAPTEPASAPPAPGPRAPAAAGPWDTTPVAWSPAAAGSSAAPATGPPPGTPSPAVLPLPAAPAAAPPAVATPPAAPISPGAPLVDARVPQAPAVSALLPPASGAAAADASAKDAGAMAAGAGAPAESIAMSSVDDHSAEFDRAGAAKTAAAGPGLDEVDGAGAGGTVRTTDPDTDATIDIGALAQAAADPDAGSVRAADR